MSEFKIRRKIRFLPLFPYGYCSKQAASIEGRNNPYAGLLLLRDDQNETTAQCLQHRRNALDRARYLCTKKYAKDANITCGKPPIPRSFRHITKLGLTVLIEAPDEAAGDDAEDTDETSTINGKIKEDYFRSGAMSSTELRDLLHEYAISDEPGDQQTFRDLLLDAVMAGRVTPLSYAIDKVQDVKTSTTKYSQNQMLNTWRLSNIQAMFLANDHLTYLDRRQFDTGFAIDGITDDESFEEYTKKHGLTIPALTYYALTNWYRDNPDFYQITQQIPDPGELAKEDWLNTPAFYATRELPNYSEQTPMTVEGSKGTKKTINAIYVGLATGVSVNYICYYAKPGEFKWMQKRERAAKEEITQAVHQMKTLCPEMRCSDKVDFALHFCSTMRQFEELFEPTKKKHVKNKKLKYTTSDPYIGMFAVPVNDSGTFLLWLLLEYSPMEVEQKIRRGLIATDESFAYSTNRIYPLTYKGKRVFSGYTMDIEKINHVLEDYLDGHDFYICCFPEQAPWYEKLFPGKVIL